MLVNINTVDWDRAPRSSKELDSFLVQTGQVKCFVKGVGGWYKIQEVDGVACLLYVNRTLYTVSFRDWLEVVKNDKFSSNIR